MKLEDKLLSPTEVLKMLECERKHFLYYKEHIFDFMPDLPHRVWQFARHIDVKNRFFESEFNPDQYAIEILFPLKKIIDNDDRGVTKEEFKNFLKFLNPSLFLVKLDDMYETTASVIGGKINYENAKLDIASSPAEVFPIRNEAEFERNGVMTRIDNLFESDAITLSNGYRINLGEKKKILGELKTGSYNPDFELQMEVSYNAMEGAANVGILTIIDSDFNATDRTVWLDETTRKFQKLEKRAKELRGAHYSTLSKGRCRKCRIKGVCDSYNWGEK